MDDVSIGIPFIKFIAQVAFITELKVSKISEERSITSWAVVYRIRNAEMIVMGFVEPFTKELKWNMQLT